MLSLLEKILRNIPYDIVSTVELSHLLVGTSDSRRGQIKRAMAATQLLPLRRGLYVLAPHYRRQELHPFVVAHRLLSPSYISFESALAYHGLIPEAVYTTTCACLERAASFDTSVGAFCYRPIPQRAFMAGVQRLQSGPHIFLMASPLKALSDYVYSRRLAWTGLEPLVESLRIDPEDLNFAIADFETLRRAYQTPRLSRFLSGLHKALATA